jgi:Tfp pilus assembly protein PilW
MHTFHTKGFTLVETVIVTALMLLLLIVLYQFFLITNTLFLTSRGDVTAAREASSVVTAVERSMRQASHTLASRTFSGVGYTVGPSTLILEIPSIDGAGVVLAGKYDYAVFYLQGQMVYERFEADAASSRTTRTRQLSDRVSALTFTYDNNNNYALVKAVTVDVTTQTVIKEQAFSSNLRQQIYRRN